MRILGIGLSHCCGVCLIDDDQIVFAQDEDWFSRQIKNYNTAFEKLING